MTAPFECEVRFLISDIAAFRARLEALGAVNDVQYAFTDHYFRPREWSWDPRTRALRIREWREPARESELLLTCNEVVRVDRLACKRSLFPEGKLCLHRGAREDCERICDALGFAWWLDVVKSDCGICDVPGLGQAIYERVEGLGWTSEVEVEGSDPAAAVARIEWKLASLGVPPDAVTDEPMVVLVAERLGLLPPFSR